MELYLSYYFLFFLCILYLFGFSLALSSLFESRTPQGSMAWFLSLTCLPFISIPLYFFFGKKKIDNYDSYDSEMISFRCANEIIINAFKYHRPKGQRLLSEERFNFISGNSITLLIDGEETFSEMLQTISEAKDYIFLQMYIFRTDKIGKMIIEALVRKATAGVKVYVLYEKIGIRMSKSLLSEMKRSGILFGEFSPTRFNKFQFNFRNHRKQLIVDGKVGFFGGINIGDDYLGKYSHIGYWRDSNVKIKGPVLGLAQLDFIKDWKFSQSEAIEIQLHVSGQSGDSNILHFSTSPDEERPINLLQHIELIHKAKKRIWIANPYVIPPQGLLDALYISSMRGIDIRIIIPKNNDNELVALAMDVHSERLFNSGIKIFKYKPGMMHQKVILIDDDLAIIGSSNFDFRSMYLNFENSIITDDQYFIKELEFSFRNDFMVCYELTEEYFGSLSKYHRLKSYLINSLAPVL
jgi:cardiolipin synthase